MGVECCPAEVPPPALCPLVVVFPFVLWWRRTGDITVLESDSIEHCKGPCLRGLSVRQSVLAAFADTVPMTVLSSLSGARCSGRNRRSGKRSNHRRRQSCRGQGRGEGRRGEEERGCSTDRAGHERRCFEADPAEAAGAGGVNVPSRSSLRYQYQDHFVGLVVKVRAFFCLGTYLPSRTLAALSFMPMTSPRPSPTKQQPPPSLHEQQVPAVPTCPSAEVSSSTSAAGQERIKELEKWLGELSLAKSKRQRIHALIAEHR